MISTSRSAVTSYLACARKRFLNYEADGRGWERVKLTTGLAVGLHVHKGISALFAGSSPTAAASSAGRGFRLEASARGLVLDEGADLDAVIEEQAAQVEALVIGWARVRLPQWKEDYEVVAVEQESPVDLSPDITLQTRADAIIRRKRDNAFFVVNFKTISVADDRWRAQWSIDMQMMTELLGAEKRLGREFAGTIVEGLVKGHRSKLLYGYTDGEGHYQSEHTARRGWERFAAWKESSLGPDPLSYWINWLPEEVVEPYFPVVGPVKRDRKAIDSCVRQIVALEKFISTHSVAVICLPESHMPLQERLDIGFPQNTYACLRPSRCQFYEVCHEGVVPAESGLYRPRVDHHAAQTEE